MMGRTGTTTEKESEEPHHPKDEDEIHVKPNKAKIFKASKFPIY